MRAFAYNVNLRVADEGRADVTDSLRVHEIGVRRDGYTPDIDLGVVGRRQLGALPRLRRWTRS